MAKREPASIRYKNPGAMWGSALAVKWGALAKAVTLNDGTGQGNNIAVFPTYVQGICAQLDLWRTSQHYKNKRFSDAIAIWSGHNHVESYIDFVLKRVPGMTRDTILNDAFWQSEKGIAFLKAQAWHEAGKKYPAPDGDWIEAQRRVFSASPPANAGARGKAVVSARTVGGVVGGTVAAAQGVSAVVGPVSDTVEQVRVVTDSTGQIIEVSKQVVEVVPAGFWQHVLVTVRSPTFLAVALAVVLIAWFFTWYLRRHQN